MEDINILNIIRKAPKDHIYYSLIHGELYLELTRNEDYYSLGYFINGEFFKFNKYGKIDGDGECLLFPSKEERDWLAFEKSLEPENKEKGAINLLDLIPQFPVGHKFYCRLIGECKACIKDINLPFCILCSGDNGDECTLTKRGEFYPNLGECMLFPSKDEQDWEKYHKTEDDLPFGTIVMANNPKPDNMWRIGFYTRKGHCSIGGVYPNQLNERADIMSYSSIVPLDKFDPETNQYNEEDDYGTESKRAKRSWSKE